MLDFFPFPLLAGLLALMVVLALLWRRGYGARRLAAFSVFWAYLLLVVALTLFPIPLEGAGATAAERAQKVALILGYVNLLPFRYLGFFNASVVFDEIVQNILLTVPFGFGLPFFAPVRARHIPWLAAAAGLGIEGAQFAISLAVGAAYRTVDISDVLLNATGALLGYGFYAFYRSVQAGIAKYPN